MSASPDRSEPGPALPDPPSSGALPRPRPDRPWAELVRAELAARGIGPARVAALVVALAAVAALAWWLSAPSPPPVEETLPRAADEPVATRPPASSTTTTAVATALVHAAGAVSRPGVVRVPSDARVADVIDAAGGLAADADLDRVNLAATVADGSRVYVPRVGQADVPVAEGGGGMGSGGDPVGSERPAPTGPVDLNAAVEAQLDELPGVGPATAAAIVAHREAHGPFTSVDDLLEVRGIGEAKLAALRDLVTV